MTTKAVKPVKSGIKPTIDFTVPILSAYRRKPIIKMEANKFADLDVDLMPIEAMRSIIQTIKVQVLIEQAQRQENVPLADDIMNVLRTPEFNRNPETKELVKSGPEQSPTAKSRVMKERRIANNIRLLIEQAWDDIDEQIGPDEKLAAEELPFELTLKADDAIWLAEQMIQHYEVDYLGTSFHVVEAHDLFTELLNEATPLWKAYETGSDGKEEELDEEEPEVKSKKK